MQYKHSTALGSSNLKSWLYLFDYMFWSWWPLCPGSCKLVQNTSDVSVTLVAPQMQPEHFTALYIYIYIEIFNPRFGLCFFYYVFWSCFPLCSQNCKLRPKCCKYTCQKGWGHLGCKLNATWAFSNTKFILFGDWVVYIWLCVLIMMSIVPTELQTCAKHCKYTCQEEWGHLSHKSSATWALVKPIFIHP